MGARSLPGRFSDSPERGPCWGYAGRPGCRWSGPTRATWCSCRWTFGPTPMNVGAVAVLGAGPGFRVEYAGQLLGERICAVSRQRLCPAPPGCGRPFWPMTRVLTCINTSGRCPARHPVTSGQYWTRLRWCSVSRWPDPGRYGRSRLSPASPAAAPGYLDGRRRIGRRRRSSVLRHDPRNCGRSSPRPARRT